ncbi:MAG TPA: VOC family protein [Propionibacteriaceae bacterium]|nr:VOC family protein [Propionibacteriaceae bacterium]
MTMRVEIFPSDDLGSTIRFYVEVLGFVLVRDESATEAPYVALERGEVKIGAAARCRHHPDLDHRRPPTGVELVLEVDDLDSELDRVRSRGWPIEEELTRRPWGLRDFRLLDPNGYYLRITERNPDG